ncbi:MAG TPA: VTT domain-containing protein [Verrucomicrobiae bacterium]
MRLVGIFIGLAVLFLVPFLIWGEELTHSFSFQGSVEWLRQQGQFAWLAGLVLLASDLVLPIPATAVMAALGLIYGPVIGGLIGAVGSFLSGFIAYGLCRMLGRKAAVKVVGEEDLKRGEELFTRLGGWLVAVSRWLPLFPEVIACMAGLTRMPVKLFAVALLCGSVPMAFTYAAIGHAGVEHPGMALALSALVPPVLWLVVQGWIKRRAYSNSSRSE